MIKFSRSVSNVKNVSLKEMGCAGVKDYKIFKGTCARKMLHQFLSFKSFKM